MAVVSLIHHFSRRLFLTTATLICLRKRSAHYCNLPPPSLPTTAIFLRLCLSPPPSKSPSPPLSTPFATMTIWSLRYVIIVTLSILWNIEGTIGIRFVIDREECFSHHVQYEGDSAHVSFVVIKTDTAWREGDQGVDLVIKGPHGEHIHDFSDKISGKYEFLVQKRGLYRFCFTNKSPYHETIDFDLYVGHFAYFDQHAKDEHFNPLLEQISKLEDALYNIQFEQHWSYRALVAFGDENAIRLWNSVLSRFYVFEWEKVHSLTLESLLFSHWNAVNEGMSRRALHKAMIESVALVGASVLQVYLMQRLFERKISTSRV
ncbi:hypothetical protein TEA_003317 [Camellia sinensis var. sinensis]|uniref:GOLD domain-containing protein n=1 Tax=Camellia sinensis var. sinensis TaxID=542762 RepID=A0A4S4CZQ5_CAMSN|nr:hypothetical protein TEA_003317 [Camellia sinensis var. sinensis]